MRKLIMMAFHENCGNASQTGERDYLLVQSLKFDRQKLSVHADMRHIDIVEAVGKHNLITVNMGSYTPGSLNGTVGFHSQAGTILRNGARSNPTTTTDFDMALDHKIGYTTSTGSFLVVRRHDDLDEEVHLYIRGWFSNMFKKVKETVKSIVDAVKKNVKFIPL